MSATTFYVSKASVKNLKQRAARALACPLPSSHLSEAVAAALGFNTHAALLAAFAGSKTIEVQKPNNSELIQRLRSLGHSSLKANQMVLPDFDHSYAPLKSPGLQPRKGERWFAARNLLVSAINAGLEQRLFGLLPGEDWFDHIKRPELKDNSGYYDFVFDGEIPARACISTLNGNQLSIFALIKLKHEDMKPRFFPGFLDGDACAHSWLERRLGIWLLDGALREFSCPEELQSRLARPAIVPNGFSDQGSFIV